MKSKVCGWTTLPPIMRGVGSGVVESFAHIDAPARERARGDDPPAAGVPARGQSAGGTRRGRAGYKYFIRMCGGRAGHPPLFATRFFTRLFDTLKSCRQVPQSSQRPVLKIRLQPR